MNTLDQAKEYAHRLHELALQAAAGLDVLDTLHIVLSDAKQDLGGGACVAAAACRQHLLSFMRDTPDDDSAVMYNAVLNWAIRDLGQERAAVPYSPK